jgi:hypothetical protein
VLDDHPEHGVLLFVLVQVLFEPVNGVIHEREPTFLRS